jgi:antitoxin ParD1/3/4
MESSPEKLQKVGILATIGAGGLINVEKVSVALTSDMATMVKQAVESGEYASSSEVVREALRDWKTKRAFAQHQIDELRRLVADGLASGSRPWLGADAMLEEIQRRADAKVKR